MPGRPRRAQARRDFVHGLSPVLAIEQRTGGAPPRTTIATVTEVSDEPRGPLGARVEQRRPKDGGRVVRRSLDENVNRVLAECPGERVMRSAPGPGRARCADEPRGFASAGFQRVRLGGKIRELTRPPPLRRGRPRPAP